jgi:hypothetical protein
MPLQVLYVVVDTNVLLNSPQFVNTVKITSLIGIYNLVLKMRGHLMGIKITFFVNHFVIISEISLR